jgi:ankyrin repeat protein
MSVRSGTIATGTVGSTTVRQSHLHRSDSQRLRSFAGSQSNLSSTYDQASEPDDGDGDDEGGVYLPAPPQAAHTTTRKVAALGPPLGSSHYAPGMLHRLSLQGDKDAVSALLQMKEGEEFGSHSTTPLVDVNMYDNQGMTALHCAAASGMHSTVQVLLEERADPNIGKQNSGYAALHFACEGGHLEVIRLLVKHRAGVGIRSIGE